MVNPILRIRPGEVRVAGITRMLDTPSVKVWHVDLHTKYAQILTYTTDEVLLICDDRTLHADESLRGTPTGLAIGLPDDWFVIAESTRYTCRIVGYLPRPDYGDSA